VIAQQVDTPRITPIPVEVVDTDRVTVKLDGDWKFNPAFTRDHITLDQANDWNDIKVPGEWTMQGFNVEPGSPASFFRTFRIPYNWKNHRIKLRFNAVYSEAQVYVNGLPAGSHLGGFTAFELDITDLVKHREANTLMLAVTSESLADSLASGSQYACHPLGGIPRSVSLIALPEINISALALQTTFDQDFKDALLQTQLTISNEAAKKAKDLELHFALVPWNSTEVVPITDPVVHIEPLKAGNTALINASFAVKKPKKWDCENPNLYVLLCRLVNEGEVLEVIKQRFGFRQSEVKGNQLFVNGKPVKLRGVNRHEVYPLTGRSVPKELYRKDIELFREGNVNHIRTCHYPPDQALMEAADELGMFIECEGPYCWSHVTKGDEQQIQEVTTRQNLEMIVLYRNHPSVIFWSMSNESHWSEAYAYAGKAMKALDPSRPLTFNFFPWGQDRLVTVDEEICELGSDHYPGPGGPKKFADYHRPISFGEFTHLNAYNRNELATDVALRDLWGIYLHSMWEDMYAAQGVAGGSIWAGIDDTFYWDYPLDDGTIEERTVGYGTWGPIDGWRRKKPEWWGMKKTYSPIRAELLEKDGNKLILKVENRQDFSNLNRLEILWRVGTESGTIKGNIPPRSSGEIIISTNNIPQMNDGLELKFMDSRGFMVDHFKLTIPGSIIKYQVPLQRYNSTSLKHYDDHIRVVTALQEFRFSTQSGMVSTKCFTGPQLMVLPKNNGGDTQMHGPTKYYKPENTVCSEWEMKSIDTTRIDGVLYQIKVNGSYKEAKGSYTYTFKAMGRLTIEYDFTLKEDINPRQIGLVFTLPDTYDQLHWKRKGYWSTYPDWHIARLDGSANAFEGVEATPVGPRKNPYHEWRHDRTAIGSNDFASTKHNVLRASLQNEGGETFAIRSNKKQHIRCWIDGKAIKMLVADYSNGGSERFLRPHVAKDDRPLTKGDRISGSVTIELK